jgi:gamma-glutamylaminecyclotransferase
MEKVFVYGTLKRGHSNSFILERAKFLGEDTIKGKMLDLGPYPCVVRGNKTVHGEVYEIGPATLKRMDYLEGHPDFYTRHKIETGNGHQAWAYFIDSDEYSKFPEIPEGVWV